MNPIVAQVLLLIIVIFWGMTFSQNKEILEILSPLYYIAFRFLIASVLLCVIFFKRIQKNLTPTLFKQGAILGALLGGGFITQTIGLQYTTAGKGGFITGTCVLLVPVFSLFLLKKKPLLSAWIGVVLAGLGLGFLTLNSTFTFQPGDLWVMTCTVFFGLQIVGVSRFMESGKNTDPLVLGIIQILFSTLIFVAFAHALEPVPPPLPTRILTIIVWMAIVPTAFAFVVQTMAQRVLSATKVGLIFSWEPIFAAFFGWLWLGEVLTHKELFGCFLILCGTLISELDLINKKC